MEFHEVLGYAVDGLFANMERIEKRDGVDSPQYKVIKRKYQFIYALYRMEHLEQLDYIIKQK